MDVERSAEADDAASTIAAAIGESARARILFSLLDGRARTATELALVGDVVALLHGGHRANMQDDAGNGRARLENHASTRAHPVLSNMAQPLEREVIQPKDRGWSIRCTNEGRLAQLRQLPASLSNSEWRSGKTSPTHDQLPGSPLKKPSGEGTGPAINADFRENLPGRVPSCGCLAERGSESSRGF